MWSLSYATELGRDALLLAAELSLPVLVVGLIVGLAFAVLQALTQVHEQTLSFIPKLFAMGAMIFLFLPWFLSAITDYTEEIFKQIGR